MGMHPLKKERLDREVNKLSLDFPAFFPPLLEAKQCQQFALIVFAERKQCNYSKMHSFDAFLLVNFPLFSFTGMRESNGIYMVNQLLKIEFL